MKNIVTILLMLLTLTAYSQTAPLNLAVTYQITNPGSTGTFPTFTVAGFTGDVMFRWNATNVAVGDSLYVLNNGQDLAICRVATINSAVSNSLNITVTCITPGVTSLEPGQAAIIRATGTNRLPTQVAGLRADLQSLIFNRFSQLVDKANIEITNYIGIADVAPAVAASSYAGQTWRNSVGESYYSNGSSWLTDKEVLLSATSLNGISAGRYKLGIDTVGVDTLYISNNGTFRRFVAGGSSTAIPTAELAIGNGTGITSDTTLKYLLSSVPGLAPQNNVLQMGRKVVGSATNPLSSIRIKNKYGYWYGGVPAAKTANIPILIDNPTDDSFSVPFYFKQDAYNNNAVAGGISGTSDSSYNNVMKFGFNPDGNAIPSRQSIWLAMEPSWGNGGQMWQEFHMSNRAGTDGQHGAFPQGERRFGTWIAKNLKNASLYNASWDWASDEFRVNNYNNTGNGYLEPRGIYFQVSRGIAGREAVMQLKSSLQHSMAWSVDSVQNLYKFYNAASAGQTTSAYSQSGFNRNYMSDNLNRQFFNYTGQTNEFRLGGDTYSTRFYLLNLNCNSGHGTSMLGDLTSSLYSARGQLYIGASSPVNGWFLGYRSDANFSYMASQTGTAALSHSFKKYSFGQTISGTYPQGTGFFNIYTEQAGTIAALRLTTNADSIGFFVTGADPNGVITARPGSKAFSSAGKTYTKVTGNNTNTGWSEDGNISMSWFQTGNTVAATNKVIGTLDNFSLGIKTNNVLRVKVDSVGNVGIKAPFPLVSFEVGGTDAIKLPSGTTAQKPSGVVGYIRSNTDSTAFEGYANGTWRKFLRTNDTYNDIIKSNMLQETVTGITGTTVTFTNNIAAGTNTSRIHVFKNGVLQLLTTHYTINTSTPFVITVVVAATAPDLYTFQVY